MRKDFHGRNDEQAYRGALIESADYDIDTLLGDVVGHWIRHEGLDDDEGLEYSGDFGLFYGNSECVELRFYIQNSDKALMIYGHEVEGQKSRNYIDKIWPRRIEKILDRNKTSEQVEIDVDENITWENIEHSGDFELQEGLT